MPATDTVQSTTDQPQPTLHRPPHRRRPVARWVVAGAGIGLAGFLLGLSGAGRSGEPGPAAPARPAVEANVEATAGTGTANSGADLAEPDASQPGPGPALDQTGVTPEVEEPEAPAEPEDPAEPQPPVELLPATLVVTPDPVHLKAGVYQGSITVANVGDEPMQWSALSKPWVSLSDTTGDLGGHGENVITFTVDESALDAGSFSFKIKVWGNGGTEYVDVTGAKPFFELSA